MTKCFTYIIATALSSIIFASCRHNRPINGTMDLCDTYSDIETVDILPADTIYSFFDEYPVGIETTGDKLFLIFAIQDTTIKVIDTESKTIIKSMGRKGEGPDDVLTPSFFYNRNFSTDSNTLTLVDPNIRKLIKISLDDYSMTKPELPSQLKSKSSINLFDSIAVAYHITLKNGKLFSIMHLGNNTEEHTIDFPFDVNEENRMKTADRPTYFASNINANILKQRIIVSMYYFDAYYVYDFDGNLLNDFHLSDCEFNINTSINRYFNLDERGYVRYTRGYGTDDYCYLRRLEEKPDPALQQYTNTGSHIIKTDWDGNPISVLNIPDGFSAFCIDSNDDIIAIVNTATTDETERFDIIRFTQP